MMPIFGKCLTQNGFLYLTHSSQIAQKSCDSSSLRPGARFICNPYRVVAVDSRECGEIV